MHAVESNEYIGRNGADHKNSADYRKAEQGMHRRFPVREYARRGLMIFWYALRLIPLFLNPIH